jgi:RNA polymerase sigma-70 factor (ECF subfamily)
MGFEHEKSLIRDLKRQRPRALEAVIRRYGGYVMAVALRTLGASGCHADAEEIAADTFAALWRCALNLRPESRLKPWLAVVARNTALKHLRSRRPELAVDDTEMAGILEVAEAAGLFGIGIPGTPGREQPSPSLQHEPPTRAAALFADLPSSERELLERHYIDGESIHDIAATDATTIPAIKSRLYRSRNVLRKNLSDQPG